MSSLLKLELCDEWFSLLGEVWSVALLVPLKYWAVWLYIADCFGIKRDLSRWSLYSKDLKSVYSGVESIKEAFLKTSAL